MMLGKQALTQFLKRLDKGASVLDVGDSNNSSAYKIMREAGMKVKAVSLIEPADIVGRYENVYTSGQWAIWCCHCLEHVRNPGNFLDKIFDDLNEGGLLCVTVPPAGNYLAGGHVTIWNEYTLLYQLVLAGFDCSSAWVRRYDYNISVLVQKKTADLRDLVMDSPDKPKIQQFMPKEYR